MGVGSDEHLGAGISRGINVRLNYDGDGFEHWKYPETLGNDSTVDDINFNSHQASEYAIDRMSAIDPITKEPFIMFEFMKVDNDDYGSSTGAWATKQWEAVKDDFNSLEGGSILRFVEPPKGV